MQVTLSSSFFDTITPDLRGKLLRIENRRPILDKIGELAKQTAARAFNDSSLRPTAWANKSDGSPARLRKQNLLARSPRVTNISNDSITVGSDRKYAAIHQLGGQTRAHVIKPRPGKKALKFGGKFYTKVNHPGSKIPARPFLPFFRNGSVIRPLHDNIIYILERLL